MDLNIDEIIKCYFNQKNILVNHQLKSYDEFIDKILPNIISNYFPIIMTFDSENIKRIVINVNNVNIGKPFTTENNGYSNLMTPNESRLRNYSYLASIIVDFESTIYINDNGLEKELEKKIIKNILIGSIPILLRSKYCTLNDTLYNEECEYDYGGYSIINGNDPDSPFVANEITPSEVMFIFVITNELVGRKTSGFTTLGKQSDLYSILTWTGWPFFNW